MLIILFDFYLKSFLLVAYARYIETNNSPFFSSAQKRKLWIALLVFISLLPFATLLSKAFFADVQSGSNFALVTVVLKSGSLSDTAFPTDSLTRLEFTVLALYLSGVILHFSRICLSVVRMCKIRGAANYSVPARVLRLLDELKAGMGIKQKIRIGICPLVSSPVTFGTISPTIIFPSSRFFAEQDFLRNVLVHELGHIQKRDSIVHLIAYLLAAINWFNPFVWYALNKFNLEAEYACDDEVLRRGEGSLEFATQLVGIARAGLCDGNIVLAGKAIAPRGSLTLRVEHILQSDLRLSSGKTHSSALALSMLSLIFVVVTSGNILRPGDEESLISEELRLLYSETPTYPEGAVRKGASGITQYSFRVDESGRIDPESIRLLRAEGHPFFDEVSRNALRSFVFSPRRENGRTVETSSVKYTFQYDMRI